MNTRLRTAVRTYRRLNTWRLSDGQRTKQYRDCLAFYRSIREEFGAADVRAEYQRQRGNR